MIYYIRNLWRNYLNCRFSFFPTLTFIPFLYLFGWLISQPLRLLNLYFLNENLSLIGSLISLTLLLFLLPSWIKIRWRNDKNFVSIGLSKSSFRDSIRCLTSGFLHSSFLIFLLLIILHLGSWLTWQVSFTLNTLLNAIFLGLVIGFAEEVIFRGWLFGELISFMNIKYAIILQSIIFSLVHLRFNENLFELISLFLGLLLLGLVLAHRRLMDDLSIFGCIGFHGGLVGIWFFIDNSVIDFSISTPRILFGSTGDSTNPISGLVAISFLLFLFLNYRLKGINSRRAFDGTCKASSIGAKP